VRSRAAGWTKFGTCWVGDKPATIRDFRHAPYVIDGAECVVERSTGVPPLWHITAI